MKDFYYYQPRRKHLIKRDEIIAEKVLELANLVGAALVFGQFLAKDSFNAKAFAIGAIFLIVFYILTCYYLSRFK